MLGPCSKKGFDFKKCMRIYFGACFLLGCYGIVVFSLEYSNLAIVLQGAFFVIMFPLIVSSLFIKKRADSLARQNDTASEKP